jgi:hypothetical protein
MSLDLARNDSYAHPDDAWVRHQSARVYQRHLQFGQHWRLDLEVLLVAAAHMLPRPSALATSYQASKDSEQWRLATACELLDTAEA